MGWVILIIVLWLCGCEIGNVSRRLRETNETLERIARELGKR